MSWNWEQSDWPRFTWNQERLARAEQEFLVAGGIFLGTVKHLDDEDRNQLRVEAMSTEALTTSEIEGEILDRASVQSSIKKQLGLAPDGKRIKPAERGVSEMMVDLYRTFSEPLSEKMMCNWHHMLMSGRHDLNDVGRFRSGDEPMQVISGAIGSRKVHFEAPPSTQIPGEMKRFVEWFNRTTPGQSGSLTALVRAGTAHLYFESIHPFEDGNGRIGRALVEKALAQSLGQPTLIALAARILVMRKSYYDALEAANKRNEITLWLAWFAGITLEAQRHTIALIEFLIAKTKMFDRLNGQLNDRQRKALLRMFREGPRGFTGGLSAGKYSTITGASPATATRDLADLVEKGALVRRGERKYARYALNMPIESVPHIVISGGGEIEER